jgi:protein gp37
MGAKSSIEWTDASWSPIRARNAAGKIGWHCERVSEGCRNCYSESMNKRLGTGLEGGATVTVDEMEFVLQKGEPA